MTVQPDGFLPTSREEVAALGWDRIDVLLVTGDAYVDHPAFGAALLGRWLASHGFRVGVVAQPRWDRPDEVARMGRPRLLVGVTAGALDSMLAGHTAFRAKRRADAYAPGGRPGLRPDRASIVYANLARQAFPGLPVVLGGIEASLRRITHYDFWSDRLRRSILLDAKADLLLYGMAERALLETARRLERGEPLDGIPGSARISSRRDISAGAELVELPSHEAILEDRSLLMDATLALERQVHQGRAWAVQEVGGRQLLIAPPAAPLAPGELDTLYALPFTRRAHPSYREPIPAEEMIRFSVTSHRGCAGGCSFCSLALHQGRAIRSRSQSSLAAEIAALTRHGAWRGSVSDVGGPSANMWGARCLGARETCERPSCLVPGRCQHLDLDQAALAALLRRLAHLPGVKHVRVASGVRHDLALESPAYLEALCGELTGGQLKLAPEHTAPRVLRLMRKPGLDVFERFLDRFQRGSERAGKRQYVVPYLISAFPGCTDRDMEQLARWLARRGWRPRQVQCFVPTPGTVATAMYFCGTDPEGRAIPVARTDAERLRQHRILSRRKS